MRVPLTRQQWGDLLVALLVVGFFTFFSLNKMSFHGDESFYISEGIHAFSLVLQGKLLDPWWSTRSSPYYIDPVLPELVFGAVEHLAGIANGSWYFWAPDTLAFIGQVPPIYVLQVARTASAVTAILTLPPIYFIGRRLAGHFVGMMAVVFLGFETLWMISARRAMGDVFGVCFSVFSLLLFVIYVHSDELVALYLCGISQGAALASKYAAVFGLVATVILVAVLRRGPFSVRKLLSSEVILVGSSISFGIILNPYYYPDPINGLLKLAKYMSGGFGFATVSVSRSSPFTTFLGVMGSLFAPWLTSWNYPGTYTSVTISVLFVIGFVKLVAEIRRSRSIGNLTGMIVLTWLGTYVAGLSLTDNAIYISRYFLPLIPLICLISAYGLSIMIKGMGPRLSALTISGLTLSVVLNFLAFYPEFYQAAWELHGLGDNLPSQQASFPSFGTLQLAVTRPLGIVSVALSAVVFTACALFWVRTVRSVGGGMGRGKKGEGSTDSCLF